MSLLRGFINSTKELDDNDTEGFIKLLQSFRIDKEKITPNKELISTYFTKSYFNFELYNILYSN